MLYILYADTTPDPYEGSWEFEIYLTPEEAKQRLAELQKHGVRDFGIFRVAEVIDTNMAYITTTKTALNKLCGGG